MRNEQVICDGCKKTWNIIQGGLRMSWDRHLELDYTISGFGFNGIEGEQKKYLRAELCDSCMNKVRELLYKIGEFCIST